MPSNVLVRACYFLAVLHMIWSASKAKKHLVTIKKPYEIVFHKPTTLKHEENTHEPDQSSIECPMPYMSSSWETGCKCDLESKSVNCIYSNLLSKPPHLTYNYNVDLNDVGQDHRWNVDLRCKNFSVFNNFSDLIPLEHVGKVDLSYDFETVKSLCKISLPDKIRHISSEDTVNRLTAFGDSVNDGYDKYTLIRPSLQIEYLNLSGNLIQDFKMDWISPFIHIKHLNLDNNKLIILENVKWIQSCGLTHLYLRNNTLLQIDAEFIVYLEHLDLSFNKFYQFSVEFYRTAEELTEMSIASKLINLDFSHNQLLNLPFKHLNTVRFIHMLQLNLSHNHLSDLDNDQFETMHSLRGLDLKMNRLERLDSNVFKGLSSLKHLDLGSNQLTYLGKSLQYSGESLIKLILDKNKFTHVPDESLQYCTGVKYLHIYDNRISRLNDHAFGFMSSLLEVYLGGNLISEISESAFQIHPLALRGPGLIEKIDLSSNRLTILNSSMFFYLVNLRYLILNNNQIRSIHSDVFNNINSLITLDLSLNKLTDFDLMFLSSSNFTKLRNLKLSHNKLTSIQSSQFICLSSLSSLDLSGNQIDTLSDCAFHGLQYTMRQLYLNYNQITQVNSCSFSLEFNNLRFVQLAHNPLNCTNNCEFFFTVYRSPYSINYKGIECVNNDFNLITTNELKYCSIEEYESIYKTCRRRLYNNDCLVKDRVSQEQKNRMGCEYQFTYLSSLNRSSLIVTNRTAWQDKHLFLYDVVDDYDEFDVNGSRRTSMSFERILLNNFLSILICVFPSIFFLIS